MSAVDNALYPNINTKIKYQQDWQKDFYHKKLSEFKASPFGFNKVVFLGNSITQGLLRHTDKLLGENIVNRGISGDHTDGVLARLEEIIYYKPKVVFLLIGVNVYLRIIEVDQRERRNMLQIIFS